MTRGVSKQRSIKRAIPPIIRPPRFMISSRIGTVVLRNYEDLLVIGIRILHLSPRRHSTNVNLFSGRVRAHHKSRFTRNLNAIGIIALRRSRGRRRFRRLRCAFGLRFRRRTRWLVRIEGLGLFTLDGFARVTRRTMPNRRLVLSTRNEGQGGEKTEPRKRFHKESSLTRVILCTSSKMA